MSKSLERFLDEAGKAMYRTEWLVENARRQDEAINALLHNQELILRALGLSANQPEEDGGQQGQRVNDQRGNCHPEGAGV